MAQIKEVLFVATKKSVGKTIIYNKQTYKITTIKEALQKKPDFAQLKYRRKGEDCIENVYLNTDTENKFYVYDHTSPMPRQPAETDKLLSTFRIALQ